MVSVAWLVRWKAESMAGKCCIFNVWVGVSWPVCWCFQPSQPQRSTSELSGYGGMFDGWMRKQLKVSLAVVA